MSQDEGSLHDEIYIDTSWLLMSWNESHRCVVAEWRGFAAHAEFQGAFMRTLDVLAARKADGIVHDARKLESVNDEDRQWLRETWAPLALAAGLKRLAAVVAPNHWGYREPVLVWHIFTTMSDALAWMAADRPSVSP